MVTHFHELFNEALSMNQHQTGGAFVDVDRAAAPDSCVAFSGHGQRAQGRAGV